MSKLERAFRDLVDANAEAIRVSGEQRGDWRRDLVVVRRRLSGVLGEIGETLEAERARAPTPGLAEFIARFGAVRRALARHQASWPASVLDTGNPAYAASVQELWNAFGALTSHARSFFAERNT